MSTQRWPFTGAVRRVGNWRHLRLPRSITGQRNQRHNIFFGLFNQLNTSRASWLTVKLQIFVRYPFSYFWLETGSYELIFVLSRASKQNCIEIRWPQDKINFHPVLNFALFSKVRKYEIKYRMKICDFTVVGSSVILDPAVPGSNSTVVNSLFLCHFFFSKWVEWNISKSFTCTAMASAHKNLPAGY